MLTTSKLEKKYLALVSNEVANEKSSYYRTALNSSVIYKLNKPYASLIDEQKSLFSFNIIPRNTTSRFLLYIRPNKFLDISLCSSWSNDVGWSSDSTIQSEKNSAQKKNFFFHY